MATQESQSERRPPRLSWMMAACVVTMSAAILLPFTSWGKRQLELRKLSGYRTSIVPSSQDGITVYFRGSDQDVVDAVPLVQQIVTRRGTSAFQIYVVGDVSDRGMEAIATLVEARWLVLNAESISDKGMEFVGQMRALDRLVVNGPRITCQGIQSIVRLRALEYLSLYRPEIDDKCLDVFLQMPSLKRLDLYETRVTSGAVIDFRKKRPDIDLVQTLVGQSETGKVSEAGKVSGEAEAGKQESR